MEVEYLGYIFKSVLIKILISNKVLILEEKVLLVRGFLGFVVINILFEIEESGLWLIFVRDIIGILC